MLEVKLKAGREKSVLREHPWIFSGSVSSTSGVGDGDVPGQTVKIVDSEDQFLAWGALSPSSNIRIRVWSCREEEIIGADFFQTRLKKAVRFRTEILPADKTNAFRLVHAESDGLPGLIADKYRDTLVVQFLASGVEFWREVLLQLLSEISGCSRLYERSDTDARRLEGLPSRKGMLAGEPVEGPIEIQEGDLRFQVDVVKGQKTGFFLDQRENRAVVKEFARDKRVLDCFAYTGGFGVSALAGGANRVTAVESSVEAIALGRENVALNQLPDDSIEWVEADVFTQLRGYRDRNMKFDMVILDPPKFAPTAAYAQRAARGYKDINLFGFKLLTPGGLLATFSCSGGVSEDLFQKIVAGAALDASVNAKIIKKLGPGIDHPVALNYPEGAYLKGLIISID